MASTPRINWKKKYWELHKAHLQMEQAFLDVARDLHVAEALIRQLKDKKTKK